MKKSVFDKNKHIPRFLVPKVKKRHAAALYGASERWRLFAEGCLRNRYFHERIFQRGPKCLGCDKKFNREEAKIQSKIEKHHNCYMRECIGSLLPDGHYDIYRDVSGDESDEVPDCRRCEIDNPEYFEGCLKRIFPVHGECHGDIHEIEQWRNRKLKKTLMAEFHAARDV